MATLSAISLKGPFVSVVLLGVLVVFDIFPASDSLLAQNAPVAPAPQTHEFAFTRFLGDSVAAVAVDEAGYVYVAGGGSNRTVADNVRDVLAVSLQMYLGERGGDYKDAFVAKFTPDGRTQIYARYLAGTREDFGTDIAVDESGNAYVTGITSSRNFPTTRPSLQQPLGQNCFVTKLSVDGSKVLYSTLLGGEKQDRCTAIALDGRGNAYVTGSTNSTTFAASNVVNSRALGKDWDVFAAKLDAEGRKLEYLLRFGGTSGREPESGKSGGEFATDIAVDSAGVAYVVGQTDSADFPIRTDGQPTPGAFVVRVNATGSGLLSGAYLGNGTSDAAVAVDTGGEVGEVYVTGTFGIGEGQRVLVTKLTPALNRIVYSSIITIPFSVTSGIAVDGLGRAHVVGRTTRGDLFPTLNPLQRTYEGRQAFLIVLDGAGASLLSSTVGFEAVGAGIAVDGSGGIYLTGDGWTTFGRTVGERSSGGFVSKIVLRTATADQVQVRTPVPTQIEFVKILPGEFAMRCDS